MKKSFKDKFLNALKCFKEDKDELDVNKRYVFEV